MHIPSPPWYKALNEKLSGSAGLVDAILLMIIAVSICLFFSKNRVLKTAWLVYLISP
jgi:hypothetical protein